MKTFDVKCPACGRINHNLFLEETEGWMECEDCGSVSRVKHVDESSIVAVYAIEKLTPMPVAM